MVPFEDFGTRFNVANRLFQERLALEEKARLVECTKGAAGRHGDWLVLEQETLQTTGLS